MIARKAFTVRTRSVAEVIESAPEIQVWSDQKIEADLLVVAAGFEERVLAYPQALIRLGVRPFPDALVGRYQTNVVDNQQRFAQLEPLLQRLCARFIDVDADTPERVLAAIRCLSETRSIKHVVFDISGASACFIFTVIGALFQQIPGVRLTVLYSEAGRYSQGLREGAEGEDSHELPEYGVSSVWTNPLFPGHHHDNARNHIVAFPSLHLSRMAKCLNFCGEAVETLADRNVTWVLPRTTHPEHRWRRDRTLQVACSLLASSEGGFGEDSLRSECRVDCEVLSVAHSASIVLEQVESHRSCNLFLVHMGSKLQAVGSAFAICARREVSLVYARPDYFVAQSYSCGVGAMRFLEVADLGCFISELARVGEMVVTRADGTEQN